MTQLEIYYQNDGYLRDFEYQWYYYKEFNHYSCCGYLKRHDGFWWLFFDVRIIDVLPLLSYWIETCFELPDPVTDALLLVETALTPLLTTMCSICTREVIMLSLVWEVWDYEISFCVIWVFMFEVS